METKAWGNQHNSRRGDMLAVLGLARRALRSDALAVPARVRFAQSYLAVWRGMLDSTPASTRRRWRCGR